MEIILGTIRKFETAQFSIIVDAVEDHDLDLSFDESGEVAKKIDVGDYVAFCARARVLHDGHEIASDYLGGCICESFAAFMDHKECGIQNREFERKGERGRCGSYFSDMVSQVCKEAREYLASLPKLRAA